MENQNQIEFTLEDVEACWVCYKQYFVDILNGKYNLEDARKDLTSLIGSNWDSRVQRANKYKLINQTKP